MKVIFLDVDGVLNYSGCEAKAPNGCVGIQDGLVKKLKETVFGSGAIIVLCSTWRDEWERNSLEDMSETGKYLVRKLKRQGLHISGKTDETGDERERGRAINEWLEKNGTGLLESWCVLDDEVFPDYKERGVLPHLVKTDTQRGLTDGDVKRALEILNGA